MFDVVLYEIGHKYDVEGLKRLAFNRIWELVRGGSTVAALWHRRFLPLSSGYVLLAEFLAQTHDQDLRLLADHLFCCTARLAARDADIDTLSKLMDEIPSIAKHWLRHLTCGRNFDHCCEGSCLRDSNTTKVII